MAFFKARRRRLALVGRFALASLVAFIAIGVALSMILSRQLATRAEEAAKYHAEFVANSILRYDLSPEDLAFLTPVRGKRYDQLLEFMRSRVLRYPVVRVKIWRSDGLIVFSDEPRLVGQQFEVEEDLRQAFSERETASEVTDLRGEEEVYERALATKLFATYVPVYLDPERSSGPPVAVVEIYTDYADIDAEVGQAFRAVVATLLVGLFVLYLMLLPIIRRISRTMSDQNGRLEEQAGQLRDLLAREQRAQTERKRLLDRTVRAGEDERRRLAAELHDGPIQRLTGIGFLIERFRLRQEQGNSAGAADLMARAQAELSGEIGQLRQMMSELRPPILDERGLQAALHGHAEIVARETGLQCAIEAELESRLDPASETVLYRVAQEALVNVVKHARTDRATVSLRASNGSVILRVEDHGVGFDAAVVAEQAGQDHFGLMAMRERVEAVGGRWVIRSRPGAGTCVEAILPREAVAP